MRNTGQEDKQFLEQLAHDQQNKIVYGKAECHACIVNIFKSIH
jgi:hypothetical protein